MNTLRIRGIEGEIALMRCPGLSHTGENALGDLHEIRRWGATRLVSLMERRELRFFGVEDLGGLCRSVGLEWIHAPIADFGAPDAAFDQAWSPHAGAILEHLSAGGRIAIHCLAGLGRTGTIAARILVELGHEPGEAVALVREARPGAIQSEAQLDYILQQRWRTAQQD